MREEEGDESKDVDTKQCNVLQKDTAAGRKLYSEGFSNSKIEPVGPMPHRGNEKLLDIQSETGKGNELVKIAKSKDLTEGSENRERSAKPEDKASMEKLGSATAKNESFKDFPKRASELSNGLGSHKIKFAERIEIESHERKKLSAKDSNGAEKTESDSQNKSDVHRLTIENVAQLRKEQGKSSGSRSIAHERLVRWLDSAGPPYDAQPSGHNFTHKGDPQNVGRKILPMNRSKRSIGSLFRKCFCGFSIQRGKKSPF